MLIVQLDYDLINQGLTKTKRLEIHDLVTSTNQRAKQYLLNRSAMPEVIIANQQSAGYGRLKRQFYSPQQTGIYMSLLLPNIPLNEDASLLTPMSAVAVMRAIRTICQIETQIKWVNDIYYEGRKVVGILAESIPNHGIVIGIGIDFKNDGQLKQLVEKAGVLLPNTSPITRNQLISQILLEFDCLLPVYRQKAFMAEYREASLLISKKIVVRLNEEKILTGYVQDITNNGELVIQTEKQRLQIIRAGEVERVLSW